MPIYEYRCTECEKHFEYTQRMSEDAKTECEACEGKLERLISATAFHLKGGGWYKDLYSSTKPDSDSSDGPKKEPPVKVSGETSVSKSELAKTSKGGGESASVSSKSSGSSSKSSGSSSKSSGGSSSGGSSSSGSSSSSD